MIEKIFSWKKAWGFWRKSISRSWLIGNRLVSFRFLEQSLCKMQNKLELIVLMNILNKKIQKLIQKNIICLMAKSNQDRAISIRTPHQKFSILLLDTTNTFKIPSKGSILNSYRNWRDQKLKRLKFHLYPTVSRLSSSTSIKPSMDLSSKFWK
jgi:hypothetical protein